MPEGSEAFVKGKVWHVLHTKEMDRSFPDCAVIIKKELESIQKCCDKCVNFAKTSVYVFSAKLSYFEKQAFSLLYL